MGKVVECVVLKKLQFVTSKHNLLSDSQFGFSRGDSTMGVHIRVEHIIRKCLQSKAICLVVYIDLNSAFDTIWPEGLILKLINKGIKGSIIALLYN